MTSFAVDILDTADRLRSPSSLIVDNLQQDYIRGAILQSFLKIVLLDGRYRSPEVRNFDLTEQRVVELRRFAVKSGLLIDNPAQSLLLRIKVVDSRCVNVVANG